MKQLLITIAAVLMVGCATTQLLKESPTVKAPDISIHQAAEEGKIEAVKQHLASRTNLNLKNDGGSTALIEASRKGHKEIA